MEPYLLIFVLIILNEALTELIVKASILQSLRALLEKNKEIKIVNFLNDLVSCGYCFSIWASTFLNSIIYLSSSSLVFFNILDNPSLNKLINFIFSVIIVHRASNYLHGLSDRYFDTRKDNRYK